MGHMVSEACATRHRCCHGRGFRGKAAIPDAYGRIESDPRPWGPRSSCCVIHALSTATAPYSRGRSFDSRASESVARARHDLTIRQARGETGPARPRPKKPSAFWSPRGSPIVSRPFASLCPRSPSTRVAVTSWASSTSPHGSSWLGRHPAPMRQRPALDRTTFLHRGPPRTETWARGLDTKHGSLRVDVVPIGLALR